MLISNPSFVTSIVPSFIVATAPLERLMVLPRFTVPPPVGSIRAVAPTRKRFERLVVLLRVPPVQVKSSVTATSAPSDIWSIVPPLRARLAAPHPPYSDTNPPVIDRAVALTEP